jgi:DNA invertase Pin-like site-specific DNA recombinase
LPSSTTSSTSPRRAVGVVRVSRVGDRDGERFVSPFEQAERIRSACDRDGLELVETIEELGVSGGTPLAKLRGLRRAVELVEAREAEVLVVAFFDRLVRSLEAQIDVTKRVEAAGGYILALDVEIRRDTAAKKLSSVFLGAVAEYHREFTAERTQEAKERAVARGVAPFPNIPPGYRRTADGALEVDPRTAPAVAEAFSMRARGATVMAVRDQLRLRGIDRSYHGVQALLGSRVVLGELRFGEMVNLESHPAIVDPATWQAVQRVRSPRGRRAKSDRLLARLGVLRCATCGARMVVGTANHGAYALYRCPPIGGCPKRVTVSAELAETVIVEAVKGLLAGAQGSATLADDSAEAERELDYAERRLAAAIEAFDGLEDVEAARRRLHALREHRDEARGRLARLQAAAAPAITVTAGDWDLLTLDERRDLIAAVVDHADVAPGRGPDRITVHPRGE